MKFPEWAPSEIVDAIAFMSRDNSQHPGVPRYKENLNRLIEMWTRLATRPEMQSVWRWYCASGQPVSKQLSIHSRQGLFYAISVIAEEFEAAPRLSPQAYAAEMKEIADLAGLLSAKLRKYDAIQCYGANPFGLADVMSEVELATAAEILDPDLRSSAAMSCKLEACLPTISQLLVSLRETALREGQGQVRRLPLSRKANGPTAFRSFFIRSVASHFDDSPARLAKFCSVALDDPDITADLVGKLLKEVVPTESLPVSEG